MSASTEHKPRLRLCRGLAVASGEERLVIEGAPGRHVFRGQAATEILPILLQQLDGSRDEDQLRAELGLTPAQLSQALSLLADRGLLESADTPATESVPADYVMSFLSRSISATGGYLGTGELIDTLSRAAVHVVGEPEVADLVANDLRASGIGRVSTGGGPPSGGDAVAMEQAQAPLAVVLETLSHPSALEQVITWCRPRAVPVLRAAELATHVEIGPCFLDGYTACLACMRRSRQEAGWATHSDSGLRAPDIVAGFVAAEALAISARLPFMRALHETLRVDIDNGNAERYSLVPFPDCPACGGGLCTGSAQDAESRLVAAYEWLQSGSPPRLRPLDGKPQVKMDALRKMRSQRLALPTHPRKRLGDTPRAAQGWFGMKAADGQLANIDEVLLGNVMRRVAGRRSEPGDTASQRWAPSGGEMASVELYLISEAGMTGLPGTVFRYDDLDHGLTAVRPDRISLAQVLTGTGLEADSYECVVILVAGRARLAAKYSDFAYRLAHLDAGCATTQLAAVCAGYGLAVDVAPQWDEQVGDLLGLVDDQQFISVIAGIRHPLSEGSVPCQ